MFNRLQNRRVMRLKRQLLGVRCALEVARRQIVDTALLAKDIWQGGLAIDAQIKDLVARQGGSLSLSGVPLVVDSSERRELLARELCLVERIVRLGGSL